MYLSEIFSKTLVFSELKNRYFTLNCSPRIMKNLKTIVMYLSIGTYLFFFVSGKPKYIRSHNAVLDFER